ncbi:MAG: hypothetical protein N3A63_00080 [Bacteroidetes bacterium]|nr:hypothetical protein [Bacteroidota bacterium]
MNILLSIHEWMVGTTLYTIGVLTPTRFGTIAVVSWNLSTPNIEYRLRPGPSEGSFTYRTSFYSLIYAKSILENLSIGLSWKYITNKIFVTEKDGYSFDIGFHYTITPLIFSLSFLNAGEFGNSEKLPTSIITGCSYDYYFSTITTTLFCALSSELHNHYIRGHVGAEVNYINTLFARFGYVSGFDSHNLSFGVGLHIGFVKVDYSYIPFRYSFGNSHCVTLQFSLD